MKNVKNTIRRNRRNRKGVIDVQFNWIFVMIAGFVMFLFIISIVMAQKRHADTQTSISAVNQIATLIKGKQQTANVYSEITIPSTNIQFRCDMPTKYFTFKIENSDPTRLYNEIIFAPQEINSNKLIVWSQAFTIGFPVNIFTYVSSDKSIILLYNETENSYIEQIYNDLPSNISKRIVSDPTEIDKYNSYKNLKVICFDPECPPATYNYMSITPGNTNGYATPGELYAHGKIVFHKKGTPLPDPASQETYYITKAGLYGAIFSDNVNYYKCQMARALGQFEVKRTLIESRLLLLQETFSNDSECGVGINSTLEFELRDMSDPVLNADNVSALYTNSRYIEVRNTDLQLSSCPQIY